MADKYSEHCPAHLPLHHFCREADLRHHAEENSSQLPLLSPGNEWSKQRNREPTILCRPTNKSPWLKVTAHKRSHKNNEPRLTWAAEKMYRPHPWADTTSTTVTLHLAIIAKLSATTFSRTNMWAWAKTQSGSDRSSCTPAKANSTTAGP